MSVETSQAEASGAPPHIHDPVARAGAQIRELMLKVQSARSELTLSGQSVAPAIVKCFRWTSNADGLIVWVEGADRGPLIGQSIASAVPPEAFGASQRIATAFERKASFRDAPLRVAGTGPSSGNWCISGVPVYHPVHEQFLGYRGSARRPFSDEPHPARVKTSAQDNFFSSSLPADSLRQLVHELRTPLNAIVGFADMIRGEYLGPAAERYRRRAKLISEEAGRLIAAVDDLDAAASIETKRFTVADGNTDLAALLDRLLQTYVDLAGRRNVRLRVAVPPSLPHAKVEASAVERMFSRLLAAVVGLAGEGEDLAAIITIQPAGEGAMITLALTRPLLIIGQDESDLFDPGFSPAGDLADAPALGLGFSLRLVRNLAETTGGSLEVSADRFLLSLPVASGD